MAINIKRVIAAHPRTLEQVLGIKLVQWAVPFVIIDLERDIEKGIFLTVKLSLESRNRHVRRMYRTAVRFFKLLDQLMTKAAAGNRVAAAAALRMLDFPEPNEIRLGFTSMGSYGTGVGDGELTAYLYDFLINRPEFRKALAAEPDTLGLIPGIGMDRASDIIATITKLHLVEFTKEQAAFWQFDPRCMQTKVVRNCWDPSTNRLIDVREVLPVDDLGRVFLLVPKDICRSVSALNARRYSGDFDLGGAGEAMTLKEALAADAERHEGRLERFVIEYMKDATRFKPRREFREPKRRR